MQSMTFSPSGQVAGMNAFVSEAEAFLDLRGLVSPGGAGEGFSLAIARGESLCLLAPDDVGARGIIAMVAGTVTPAAGEIVLNGRRLRATPAHRRGFGCVPAAIVLPRWQRLGAYVGAALNAQRLERAVRAARVARVLALVGLDGLAGRWLTALSRSERFRAALARALAADPSLLLIEEPEEGFAEPERQMLSILLRGSPAAAITTLIAARKAATVFALADRVAVLLGERLVQVAPPQFLYDAPISLPVARALGEANVLGGTLIENDDDIARVKLDNGIIVSGSLAESVAIGQRSLLMVRPERIAVAAIAAEELGEGALPVVLRKITPLGAQTRLVASLEDGVDIIVTRPASAILRGLQPGREMSIAWSAQHARIYAAAKPTDAA